MTIRLEDVHNDDGRCGGKAARLSAMIRAGFPTKSGVVITTEEVGQILADQSVEQHLLDEIGAAVHFPVAVRSSAIGEDGVLTWAGQFKTVLSVSSDALPEALLECARAVHSEPVSAYAATHGVPLPKLALVVQEMVDAVAAGVLFTRHPVEGTDVVIEAVDGLGESLVSGQREPRRLYVSRVSRDTRSEGAETPVLSKGHIDELCNLGGLLTTLFGSHQDVEWAMERHTGKMFLLQSRDITTSNHKEKNMKPSEALSGVLEYEMNRLRYLGVNVERDVLSDQNVAELLTPHPCQMAFGLFTYIFAHGDGAIRTARNDMGYDIGPELDMGFFHLVGGQPRCSIVHDALTYRIKGIPLSDYARLVQHYLDRIDLDPTLANYPEVVLYDQNPTLEFLTELFGESKARQFREAYDQFYERFEVLEEELCIAARDFPRTWQRELRARVRHMPDDEADLAEACEQYRAVADLLRTKACRLFVKVARLGFFAYARLRTLLTQLFGEDGQRCVDVLTSGIPAYDNPNLRLSMELKGGVYWRDVRQEFGHLAMHELEISVPRYGDDYRVLNLLGKQITGDPEQELKESLGRSFKLRRELLARAGSSKDALDRAIRMAREYLPLRELVKFEYLRGYAALRKLAVSIEKVLHWEKGAIFHLDPQEVFVLARNPGRYARIAAERFEKYELEKDNAIRPVFFSDRLHELEESVVYASNEKIFRGIGVTDAVMEGEVVLVRSPQDVENVAKLHAGAVLVTTTTDPAWSPLISAVGPEGGLVTEIGGLLAHGAIYAREIGTAAVLNIPGITKVLRTGMRVRVNARKGYVEILE